VTHPLVIVTWQDAWFDFDEPATPRTDYLVRTVGFIVAEDKGFIHVAQEQIPDGFRAITHIPKPTIETVFSLGITNRKEQG
jgi:hypothetical protein